MKIDEIKKLTPHEFAERYPFLHQGKWDPVKREYYKAYWEPNDKVVKSGYHKAGGTCYGSLSGWLLWLELFDSLLGRSIPKEKVNEAITQFYNTYIKDNIAGIHKDELVDKLRYLSSELAKTQNAINNLIKFKEKHGND